MDSKIIDVIKNKKTICLLAPSFPVDFKYPEIIKKLKEIGFNKVMELTYAAKLINHEYHDLIKKSKKPIICANCPGIVKLIENKYPKLKNNLANIASPMVVMGRYAKSEYNEYTTVFIGPCFLKIQEAKEFQAVDYALTFKDLKEIFDYYEKNNLEKTKIKNKNLEFNKLYNDYTKIYPLSGGMAKSMHYKELIEKQEVIINDDILELNEILSNLENTKNIKFLDILFCKGGCVGGPGIISNKEIIKKEKYILDYKQLEKKHKLGKHFGTLKTNKKLNLKRK